MADKLVLLDEFLIEHQDDHYIIFVANILADSNRRFHGLSNSDYLTLFRESSPTISNWLDESVEKWDLYMTWIPNKFMQTLGLAIRLYNLDDVVNFGLSWDCKVNYEIQ